MLAAKSSASPNNPYLIDTSSNSNVGRENQDPLDYVETESDDVEFAKTKREMKRRWDAMVAELEKEGYRNIHSYMRNPFQNYQYQGEKASVKIS